MKWLPILLLAALVAAGCDPPENSQGEQVPRTQCEPVLEITGEKNADNADYSGSMCVFTHEGRTCWWVYSGHSGGLYCWEPETGSELPSR